MKREEDFIKTFCTDHGVCVCGHWPINLQANLFDIQISLHHFWQQFAHNFAPSAIVPVPVWVPRQTPSLSSITILKLPDKCELQSGERERKRENEKPCVTRDWMKRRANSDKMAVSTSTVQQQQQINKAQKSSTFEKSKVPLKTASLVKHGVKPSESVLRKLTITTAN